MYKDTHAFMMFWSHKEKKKLYLLPLTSFMVGLLHYRYLAGREVPIDVAVCSEPCHELKTEENWGPGDIILEVANP
jgi:hypothetical protein